MRVTIETNAVEVSGFLGRFFRDQVPFALSRTINDIAKAAQEEQRGHQRRVFEVRRARFVDRAVKIKPFATKRRLSATIQIDPPGGERTRDILTKFETEREKRAREGRHLAVPVSDRTRTATGVSRKSMRPSALELREHGSSGRVLRGEKRTFLIRGPGGQGGAIFQRYGRRGSTKVRVLYSLESRVPIRPELDFVENVRRIVDRDFSKRFDIRFDQAVRTAR